MTITTGEFIQIASVVVSLLAALITTVVAAILSVRLARQQRSDTRRQFCFELQRQFDSPDMFRCRFAAWKMLDSGEFDDIDTVRELFESDKWTFEVSTVVHFFESLARYCDEGIIDKTLASQLFGRTFTMWYTQLLGRLAVDEGGERYRRWLDDIRKLHDTCLRDESSAA